MPTRHKPTAVEQRRQLDERIRVTAERHAATPQAADAILWAYRELLVTAVLGGVGADADRDLDRQLDDALHGAETSLLRHLPYFSESTRGAGHLSDDEVRRFFSTADLAAFAAEKRRTIENKIGGDYVFRFLGGRDLASREQLDDPEE